MAMEDDFQIIPIYPMGSVLFPYAVTQIIIENDRYIEMVRGCVERGEDFGVVYIVSGSLVGRVGVMARIIGVDMLIDGSMEVRVQGGERFEVISSVEGMYKVRILGEAVENDLRLMALSLRASELFRGLIAEMFEGTEFNVEVFFPSDPVVMSYVISHFLVASNEEKLGLLKSLSAEARYTELIPILEDQFMMNHREGLVRLGVADLGEWINYN